MKELVTNCDRFRPLKHSTSAPYAYTVFGVSMIPSVLTSQKAIDTSIRIIDAFGMHGPTYQTWLEVRKWKCRQRCYLIC